MKKVTKVLILICLFIICFSSYSSVLGATTIGNLSHTKLYSIVVTYNASDGQANYPSFSYALAFKANNTDNVASASQTDSSKMFFDTYKVEVGDETKEEAKRARFTPGLSTNWYIQDIALVAGDETSGIVKKSVVNTEFTYVSDDNENKQTKEMNSYYITTIPEDLYLKASGGIKDPVAGTFKLQWTIKNSETNEEKTFTTNLQYDKGKKIELDEGDESFLRILWGLITDTKDTVTNILQSTLCDLFIPIGDGIIGMVCASVGDIVTVDRLVFNKIAKLDVDYWSGDPSNPNSVKALLSPVVSPWYDFFYRIAICVYMITLVVVGIQVLLASTGEKKAKYKDVMISWVVGVVLLIFFPYVMKYTVRLNNAIVSSIHQTYLDINNLENATPTTNYDPYLPDNFWNFYIDELGKDKFGEGLNNGKYIDGTGKNTTVDDKKINDGMVLVRMWASKMNNIVLVAIYFILIGQVIALLLMYYKRAFMVAFLIVIYPLVAMTYVVDKVGDKKAQSFEIWLKEFVVNIIVQIFHAATYMVVVGTAFQGFIDGKGSNWLYLILSVLFLFQGEKILRGIFGAKSAANTIGDLAASGMAAYGAMKAIGGLKGGKDGGSDSTADDKEGASAGNARSATPGGAPSTPVAPVGPTPAPSGGVGDSSSGSSGGGSGSGTGGGSSSNGSNSGDSTPAQNNAINDNTSGPSTDHSPTSYNHTQGKDSVIQRAMKRRLKPGFASKGVSRAGSVVGGIMGATMQMAKGGDVAQLATNATTGAMAGSALGKIAAAPAAHLVNKAEQSYAANRVAYDIENGVYDVAAGIPGAPPPPTNINEEEIIARTGRTMEQIYREALAEYARVAGTKGKARGEEAYWRYIENHTMIE